MGNKAKTIGWGLLPFIVLLVVWFCVTEFGWVSKWLTATPYDTGRAFIRLIANGQLLKLIGISALNVIPAYLAAFTLALAAGIGIGLSGRAQKIAGPILAAFYAMPSLTWLPFIVLTLGFTRNAIWCVVAISVFLRVIHNVIGGVRNVNAYWIMSAQNLGLSRFQIIRSVVIPGALPQIIVGLRQGFHSAWRSLIAAEMLISTFGGLGKYIWSAQWTMDYAKVMSGIITIAIIGVTVEQLVFRRLERATLVKWGMVREGA